METSSSNSFPSIAVDTRALEPDFRAHFGRGTGRYVKEVVTRFSKFPTDRFSILPIESRMLSLTPFQKKLSSVLPAGKVTYESQCCMNRNLAKLAVPLAHFFFHGDAPAFPSVPQLISVLDLIPLKFPDLYQKGVGGIRYRFARYLERCAIQSAVGIITISEASKNDIVEIMGIPPERVHVTYLGVDDSFFNIPEQDADPGSLRETLGISPDAFLALYIGGIDARKNIPFLLEITAELNAIEAVQDIGGFHVILAGNYSKDDKYPLLISDTKRMELEPFVHLTGYVEESMLHCLYRNSDLFIFPSLYEGFGLPVLEAMAAGLPVVAGNNSSLPEVMGDTGWKLPDKDVGSWVSEIYHLIKEGKGNPDILTSWQEKGRAQARQFTWDITTKKTLDIYDTYLTAVQNTQ
jgi:glycosyltransferase involved in cell wall biosynthesis